MVPRSIGPEASRCYARYFVVGYRLGLNAIIYVSTSWRMAHGGQLKRERRLPEMGGQAKIAIT